MKEQDEKRVKRRMDISDIIRRDVKDSPLDDIISDIFVIFIGVIYREMHFLGKERILKVISHNALVVLEELYKDEGLNKYLVKEPDTKAFWDENR